MDTGLIATGRPRIAIVTRTWGGEGDGPAITRLIAGALAIHGDTEIVHLRDQPGRTTTRDSVFDVHTVPLVGAHPARAAIALAAASTGTRGAPPRSVVALLDRWEGEAPEAGDLLRRIAPDVIVLAGASQPVPLDALAASGRGRAPRICFVPMTAHQAALDSERFAAVAAAADIVAAIGPGEGEAFRAHLGGITPIVDIDVALPVNRSATTQGLFGVGWFGSYAVLIRRFPADGGRYGRSITHDVLRGVLGKIAVAEIDGTKWRISDAENTAELPVNPTRVNLWRLMANGIMTVDVRPPDLFGREAVESMLLGTPVVVPDDSAAKEHVAAANGGLWYRDLGEALDLAHALIDPPTRMSLGRQGRSYAEEHHGNMAGFVDRLGEVIVGR